jgi:hypothetical protein
MLVLAEGLTIATSRRLRVLLRWTPAIRVTIPIIAAVSAALILAPQAHADGNQAAFVNLVWSQGVPGTSDQILNNGYVMCNALRTTDMGIHTVAVISAQRAGITAGQAAAEVGAAIRYLCPDQIGMMID